MQLKLGRTCQKHILNSRSASGRIKEMSIQRGVGGGGFQSVYGLGHVRAFEVLGMGSRAFLDL